MRSCFVSALFSKAMVLSSSLILAIPFAILSSSPLLFGLIAIVI